MMAGQSAISSTFHIITLNNTTLMRLHHPDAPVKIRCFLKHPVLFIQSKKETSTMATDMLTSLVNSFGAPALDSLGKRLGLPPSVVKAATPMVIGLVLTGIRRLANQPGGMDSLGALLQDNSQRVGDRNLNAFLQEANPAKTEQTLDALTGSNAFDQVAANFARKTGIDPHVAGEMMGILAPAVLSEAQSLATQQGLDLQGVVNAVNANADAINALGDIDYILDDVPGISDDIKRGFDKLFGRG
jgi:hypothetical protein